MNALIELLVGMCEVVTFLPLRRGRFEAYSRALRRRGVDVIDESLAPSSWILRSRKGMYDLVILSRLTVAEALIRPVRRYQAQARVLFDTVDVASLRAERELAVTGSSSLGSPVRLRNRELRVMREADATIAVSEREAEIIRRLDHRVETVVLPNVHDLRRREAPEFHQRSDLLFVANLEHAPNRDAVLWFARDVLPLIRKRRDVKLNVVGAGATRALISDCGEYVHFHGWIREVEPHFDRARVGVVPLRYGAGVKGKLGQALALGLPTVTTTVGAEGMDIIDGVDALIRDDSRGFADAVLQLYEDADVWDRVCERGLAAAAERWSSTAMRERLSLLLARN
jgi:glycosyltransferase involved in cell wall biosynthesis